MNWLPRPSLYAEAETARAKRKEAAGAYLQQNSNTATGLIGGSTSNTGESVNLTLRIAAARLQNGTTKKV